MGQLVKRTGSLERVKHGLSIRLSNQKSLPGEQILEALVAVSEEADRRFTPELLDDFWKPFGGDYSRFVRDIASSFGLNERPLYHPHEPFSGYNKHHFLKKRNLERFLPRINFVDPLLLDKIEYDEELLLISYHIWHNMGSSTSYFDSGCVSRLHEFYLRLRGVRERSEVEEEVTATLKPHQINPSETPLAILTSQPNDLFEYQRRLFSLPQKQENYQQNYGGWVNLIWAFGVYTTWPEPIGYILFNEELKSEKKLLLPHAE